MKKFTTIKCAFYTKDAFGYLIRSLKCISIAWPSEKWLGVKNNTATDSLRWSLPKFPKIMRKISNKIQNWLKAHVFIGLKISIWVKKSCKRASSWNVSLWTKHNQSKARDIKVIKSLFSHIAPGNRVFSTRGSKCFFGVHIWHALWSLNQYWSSSKAMPVQKWTKVVPVRANRSQAMKLIQWNLPLVKLLVHTRSTYVCIHPGCKVCKLSQTNKEQETKAWKQASSRVVGFNMM